MATKVSGFRLSAETLAQLDYLCSVAGNSRTSLLAKMIAAEYDRIKGNPELLKLLSQMRDMESQMKSMLGQSDDT